MAKSIQSALPQTGFLRLTQIIGNPKAVPPIQPLIPISKTVWWAGCKTGRFPKPVKLSARTTAWRASDIAELIEKLSEGAAKGWQSGGRVYCLRRC